ncbi:hypothetical protein R1sor_020815 [Riccia sorocarpa]|uniref:Uncharacterized protein n=1 Tax=Riccia sorocarpa TaxID=122646 RepID=A0ABD3GJH1_9MARC
MLSFSIALTRFRLADLHKFERLFAVYLWGSIADGKAKTVLAAWVYVAKPLTLGGLGIWNLRVFQKALVIKLILNSIEDRELLWSDLLWNSLVRSDRGSRLRFLFLEDVLPNFQMAKFVLSTSVEIQNFWRWKPQHRLLPCLEPLRFLMQLLCKAGSITVDRLSELLTLLEDFLDTPAYVLHADSCLDRIPELADWGFPADFWNFQQDEWLLHSPISASAEGFPLTVKGVHTLLSEVEAMDTLSKINIRWLMDLTVGVCEVGTFHKPLIETVEMLLSQFRRSDRSKRELAKRALVAAMQGRAWIPEKYMLQITAILQG